jgi:uncharacterized protein (TIGR00251 family)
MGKVAVRVQPGASKSRVVGRLGDEWKIAISAPPVDGKANEALLALLGKLCGVPRSQVELLHGAGGRRKLFEIRGLDSDAIDRLLESQNTTK